MFNKISLAAIVAIAGMLFCGETQVQAQNCYRGGGASFGYSSFAPVYAAPIHSVSRYHYNAPRSFYGSPYRSGFGGYGYGSPFGGYGGYRGGFGGFGPGYYGRGTSIGVGRGGLSIGIGF